VALCCGVYDDINNIAPNFLDISHDKLQNFKYAHPLCATCMSHGIHASGLYEGSFQWLRKAKTRAHPIKLPRELIITHVLLDVRQKMNRMFGTTFVDKLVWFLRKYLFKN
jgi:hypothetical protein